MLPELLLVPVHLLLVLLEHPVDDEKREKEWPLGLNPGKLLNTDKKSLSEALIQNMNERGCLNFPLLTVADSVLISAAGALPDSGLPDGKI